MKLASLKGGRDGRLVVVSRDLAWCVDAAPVAETLQAALDDWERAEPQLRALANEVEYGGVPQTRFHEHEAASPLPRAYQWADGSAYVNHVQLVRRARGAEMPESFWNDPFPVLISPRRCVSIDRDDRRFHRGIECAGVRERGSSYSKCSLHREDHGGHWRRGGDLDRWGQCRVDEGQF